MHRFVRLVLLGSGVTLLGVWRVPEAAWIGFLALAAVRPVPPGA